jgi:protein-L-isoaspartate(D-aspartate) O-methyltransferase
MDAVAPRSGESVLHIGCGVGYYSAVFAEIVGPSGRVVAFEIDPNLAARAKQLLAKWPQVRVEAADGGEPHGPHDVVYVNAGATHARPEWLSSLSAGGRILLPLTVRVPPFPHGIGFVLRAERRDPDWPARIVSPVGIFDCAGARDEDAELQLRNLLALGASAKIGLLSTAAHTRGDACLLHVEGFCLRESVTCGPARSPS